MKALAFKTISIAGSGNVGSFLAVELHKVGYTIKQVFSRSLENAQLLASKVNAEAIDKASDLKPETDLLIIALPDRIIPEFVLVMDELWTDDARVVYTAGSVPLTDIKAFFPRSGVMYPFQSFTRHRRVEPMTIPFCIEGSNPEMTKGLVDLASDISSDVRLVSSEQRQIIHLAGVFACNFTNHLFAIANKILQDEKIEPSILWPIINETVDRLKEHNPLDMQTGPAVREDYQTVYKHLNLLKGDEKAKEIYNLLTENIIRLSKLEQGIIDGDEL